MEDYSHKSAIPQFGLLPFKPIKKFMKQKCSYNVSFESVILIRNLAENIINYTMVEAIKEFEQLNKRRRRQGLRKLKRLNEWAVLKASEKVLSNADLSKMGLQSHGVGSLGGYKMSEGKDATKSAKKECRGNGGNNEL